MKAALFSALDKRRIESLTPARRRFFDALLEERLHIAGEFDDTSAAQIVKDCLAYAESPELNPKQELAELRAPIPKTTQGQSSAGWAMNHIQE